MMSQHLIDATGIVALSLNVTGLLRPNDRSYLKTSGWASALWAFNNLLIGAHTAAALSALGVGRQASAAALLDRPGRVKALAFAAIVAATLAIAGLTWNGMHSVFPLAGSLTATIAVFLLRGTAMRAAMVLVNLLWLTNAVTYGTWWQIVANGVCGGAAAVAAWRARAA
jgi:hypothetical protein